MLYIQTCEIGRSIPPSHLLIRHLSQTHRNVTQDNPPFNSFEVHHSLSIQLFNHVLPCHIYLHALFMKQLAQCAHSQAIVLPSLILFVQ